jgi:integrase
MSVRRITRRSRKTGAPREFWIVDVVFEHPDGTVQRVRKVSPVRNRRGAEEYERKLRAELLNPSPKKKEVPTFEQFVDERWLPVYPGAAGNRYTTIVERESHLRLYLRAPFGKLRLDEIGREHIARFYADLTKKGLSPKSRKNIGGTLHLILGTAVDWEVIDKLPKFPRIKVPDAPWDFYTREESELLLSKARSAEERALLLFPLHTGARAGEQIAFEWGDIDWHNQLVIIRRSSALGRVGPTKSGRDRKIPMTSDLQAALKAIKHLRSALVFCNDDGRPLSKWRLHERLWGTARRAGLREIRWHDTRHSFASQLVMAGVPIVQVQQWMGHSTIGMTMRYAHLAPGSGTVHIKALETRPVAPVYGNLTATTAG